MTLDNFFKFAIGALMSERDSNGMYETILGGMLALFRTHTDTSQDYHEGFRLETMVTTQACVGRS